MGDEPKPERTVLAFKTRDLEAAAKVISTFTDEVLLSVDHTGLAVSAVDPAHVAWLGLTVPARRVDPRSDAPFDVLLDVEKLHTFLSHARKKNLAGDVAKLFVTPGRGRVSVECGSLHYRMEPVNTDDVTRSKKPAVPDASLKGRCTIDPDVLAGALDVLSDVADSVWLKLRQGLDVVADGEDRLAFHVPEPTVMQSEPGPAWDFVTDKDAVSQFPLDYLTNIVRACVESGATAVGLRVGRDYPTRLTWNFGNAPCIAEALLAPRIVPEESDEE